MKKLKLSFDALREQMEILSLDESNSLKGGYGGYYGYDTWELFLDAVKNGQVSEGTYYNIDQSLPEQEYGGYYQDYGGYFGDYGGYFGDYGGGDGGYSGYGSGGQFSECWSLNFVNGKISYLVDDITIFPGAPGMCLFDVSRDLTVELLSTAKYDEAFLFNDYVSRNLGEVFIAEYYEASELVKEMTGVDTNNPIVAEFLDKYFETNISLNQATLGSWLDNGGKIVTAKTISNPNEAGPNGEGHIIYIKKGPDAEHPNQYLIKNSSSQEELWVDFSYFDTSLFVGVKLK